MNVSTDPRRTFFDRVAAKWDEDHQNKGRVKEVLALVSPKNGEKILDLGAGSGILTRELSGRVGAQGLVIAADLSLGMLRCARQKKFSSPALLCQADAHHLPFANSTIDALVMLATFAHLRNPPLALLQCSRVLRPGGRLVIVHLMGSRQLREIHGRAGGPVEADTLPAKSDLMKWLQKADLILDHFCDLPHLYCVRARKK